MKSIANIRMFNKKNAAHCKFLIISKEICSALHFLNSIPFFIRISPLPLKEGLGKVRHDELHQAIAAAQKPTIKEGSEKEGLEACLLKLVDAGFCP